MPEAGLTLRTSRTGTTPPRLTRCSSWKDSAPSVLGFGRPAHRFRPAPRQAQQHRRHEGPVLARNHAALVVLTVPAARKVTDAVARAGRQQGLPDPVLPRAGRRRWPSASGAGAVGRDLPPPRSVRRGGGTVARGRPGLFRGRSGRVLAPARALAAVPEVAARQSGHAGHAAVSPHSPSVNSLTSPHSLGLKRVLEPLHVLYLALQLVQASRVYPTFSSGTSGWGPI